MKTVDAEFCFQHNFRPDKATKTRNVILLYRLQRQPGYMSLSLPPPARHSKALHL